MKFLLDTNIIVAVMLATGAAVRRRLADTDEGDVVTSAVAYAEVLFGSVRNLPSPIAYLQAFIEQVPVLPFDGRAAEAYAGLPFRRASYDRLIAAHALALDLTLVTDNERHFADVPGLRVENWTV